MLQEANQENEPVFDNENDRIVYAAIPFSRGITRSEIARLTEVPWTTIYDSIVRLMYRDLISRKAESPRREKGRPKIFYRRKHVEMWK